MHCPLCQHKFTFVQCATIVNPFKHPCPNCAAPLSFGRQGVQYIAAAVLGGFSVAGLAIYLEQAQGWSSGQALTAFAVTFAIAAGFGEWVCWKHGRLSAAKSK